MKKSSKPTSSYLVEDLYKHHGKDLSLELTAGESGMRKPIKLPIVQRPGLSLSGYLKHHIYESLLIFGKQEIEYLNELPPALRQERLAQLIHSKTPAVFITQSTSEHELLKICHAKQIPLLYSPLKTIQLQSRLLFILNEEFAPVLNCHGTLMEIFGMGVLIQGEPGIGKSDAALELIRRGHCLIADDAVKITKTIGNDLIGTCEPLIRGYMEIRGIGLIQGSSICGAQGLKNKTVINMVVNLKHWDNEQLKDPVGINENFISLLDQQVCFYELPITPTRPVALLLETLALHHRAKEMGCHSGQIFRSKLLALTSKNWAVNCQT